jgi:hypothetical protein
LSSTIVSPSWRDGWRDPWRRLGGIAVAPAPVVSHRLAGEARGLAHVLEILLAGKAAIGVSRGEHRLDHLAMARRALELADRLAIPVEAEPFQAIDDRLHRRQRRALAVGVLDPHQEPAVEPARVEPVEQRGPGAADVEEAGRGRREARHNLGHQRGWVLLGLRMGSTGALL